jgi:hypothetical protein
LNEEVLKRLRSRLCDKCLVRYDADPKFPLEDLCQPCQDRIINMVFEMMDEVKQELEDIGQSFDTLDEE